jgi:hypothetical protein
MIAAHQQITDETGATFVMLPLEEYNDLIDAILDARDAKNLSAFRVASEGVERISIEALRERLLEDAWHRRVLEESRGEESVKAMTDVSRL